MIPAALLRFLLVGVANTALGLGTIYMLKWGFGTPDVPANFTGYVLGLCLSFVLNRSWTFRHRGAVLPAALRFLSVFVAAYAANLLALFVLRDSFHVNSYLCHLLAMVPYTMIFFLGSRWFAFRQTASSSSATREAAS